MIQGVDYGMIRLDLLFLDVHIHMNKKEEIT